MSELKTSKGHLVEHEHKHPDLDAAELGMARSYMRDFFPTVVEVRRPTRDYNCHGFAMAHRHGWVTVPDPFYFDDFVGASFESPVRGDVVLYMRKSLVTHTARVVKVGRDGQIELVRSKWGEAAEVVHKVEDVPNVYGTRMTLLRSITRMGADEAVEYAEDFTIPEVEEFASSQASVSDRSDEHSQLNLMLASTPEVEQRIVESISRRQRSSTRPFSSPAVVEGGPTQEQIDAALAQISSNRVKFMLMLSSIDDVTTRIIASLSEVQFLLQGDEDADADVGAAVLNLFKKKKTQRDDRLTSILLFLLSQITVKEAAQPLFEYLFSGTHPTLNRALAGQAFLASARVEP
jgi:hypothetical protein